MREPTEQQKQQYQRFAEILEMGKQRYVDVTGTARGYRAGIKGQDYLTDVEREEAKLLMRQMFDFSSKDDRDRGSGRSHKLPDKSIGIKDEVKAES